MKRKVKAKTKNKLLSRNKVVESLRKTLNTQELNLGDQIRIRLPKNYIVTDTKSNVHHPSHYGGADNPYETIKVARAKLNREEFIGAMKFTVMKYNDRAKHKGTEIEDYEKGLWYQTELVKRAKEND